MNILKIVKNQYGKDPHRIINDIKVNRQTQTDFEDTISFMDLPLVLRRDEIQNSQRTAS